MFEATADRDRWGRLGPIAIALTVAKALPLVLFGLRIGSTRSSSFDSVAVDQVFLIVLIAAVLLAGQLFAIVRKRALLLFGASVLLVSFDALIVDRASIIVIAFTVAVSTLPQLAVAVMAWRLYRSTKKRLKTTQSVRRPILLGVVASIAVLWFWTGNLLLTGYSLSSGSMWPTFEPGDTFHTSSVVSWERGSIVTHDRGDNTLVGRIVGLPGETITFQDGSVFIDSFRLEEPYLASQTVTQPYGQDVIEIPQGNVFVMGDNRQGSSDSRTYGPIPSDNITGVGVRTWWWPFPF